MKPEETNNPLVKEALGLQEQSDILYTASVWLSERVTELCSPPASVINSWPDDRKKVFIHQCSELLGRLQSNTNELVNIHKKYENLRTRVNSKYGMELLKEWPHPKLTEEK